MDNKTQEKINLNIEMPLTGFDALALRRLSGLVAAHAGLLLEKTANDTLRFEMGECAPTEAQDCAEVVAGLCKTAKLGKGIIDEQDFTLIQRRALEQYQPVVSCLRTQDEPP